MARSTDKEAVVILGKIRDLLGFTHITPDHQALRKENEALRETNDGLRGKNDALRLELARTEEGKDYAALQIIYDQLFEKHEELQIERDSYLLSVEKD